MDTAYIHQLLERYWNCETSVPEEQELRAFFSRDDLPEAFRQYLPFFSYIGEEQEVKLSDDFDVRLKASIKSAGRKRYVTIRIFTPLLRIAASLLLIGGLGISIFFISREQNKPFYSETINDTNDAMKQATFALEKLSDALQMSEEASMETIRTIDEMDIDWSTLDSLSNIATDDTVKGNSLRIDKEKKI